MPLKIQLRPKERIIINGAVIEGHPDSRTEIVLLNKARIMRQKHILQEKEANTPAKRLYFTIQMLYIDESGSPENYEKLFKKYFDDLKETVSLPPLVKALDNIYKTVQEKNFYDAMKVCRDLIKAEESLLKMNTVSK